MVTYQVVSQELHDESGVLVALLAESIKFCRMFVRYLWLVRIYLGYLLLTSNGIIKSLLSKMTRLIRGVQDLVVEDGEVEGETEADWVGWCKVGLGNFGGVLVSFEGLVG